MHCASLLMPLAGHAQVLAPSPLGNTSNGAQRPGGKDGGGQAIKVHAKPSDFRPEFGQKQVLQPSGPMKLTPGQQRSSSSS